MGGAEGRLALLAGASGLVGGCALDALLGAPDIRRVLAVSRRSLGREHPRLANRIVQFEHLEAQLKGASCDVALCCLGTTRRQAGSQQGLREVDIDCVLAFARAAKAANARRFVVVSSVGADPGARNFYLRTKGEMEQHLVAAGFESLDILQPSLLLGWRGVVRPLELAARALTPVVNPLRRGRPSDGPCSATRTRVSGRWRASLCRVRVRRRSRRHPPARKACAPRSLSPSRCWSPRAAASPPVPRPGRKAGQRSRRRRHLCLGLPTTSAVPTRPASTAAGWRCTCTSAQVSPFRAPPLSSSARRTPCRWGSWHPGSWYFSVSAPAGWV